MPKTPKTKEPELLHVMFAVQEKGGQYEVRVGKFAVEKFDRQSEAERLRDLLNAAFHLFKIGEKSQGLDKPTLVRKKKKPAEA